jgi:ssRNA-specific RNase YbeY (16S rRNA maturation enzyme)
VGLPGGCKVRKIKILIDEKGKKIRGYRSFTSRIAAKILKSLSIENPAELSILLVDDETMLQMYMPLPMSWHSR